MSLNETAMRITIQPLAIGIAAMLLFATGGCSALTRKEQPKKDQKSFFDRMPWANNDEANPEPYPNPVKIAATWTPDTLVQTGRTPTRGFGGRIFFYDEKSRPVPVDGTLIVHGFDDAATTQEDRIKRFEFTPEQFTRHFSQSDLGASYSVWIPWDAIGGQQRRISLVTSFRTAAGGTVQGVPATVLLPGQSAEPTEESELAKLSPQYQRYLQATRSQTSPVSGLTTTTIARRSSSSKFNTQQAPSNLTILPTEMVAESNTTPAIDIDMRGRPSRTPVRPASAEIPIKRK